MTRMFVGLRRWAAAGVAVIAAIAATPRAVFAAEVAAKPPAHWIVDADKTRSNWRARALLDQQLDAAGKSGRMSGEETRIILDKYEKSIGHGGAGAKLPPRNESPSGSSSR